MISALFRRIKKESSVAAVLWHVLEFPVSRASKCLLLLDISILLVWFDHKNLCGTCGDLHFELGECVSSCCVDTCVHCLVICACSAFSEGDTFLTNGCSCCSYFSEKEICQICPYAITSGTRMFQMEKEGSSPRGDE